MNRKLPTPVLGLLIAWYQEQQMRIKWNQTFSDPFSVSNGVRQSGVLTPIFFTIYIDLLVQLKELGVGCHWNHHFIGVVYYADDLTLLAPSPSALRLMLQKCEQFADAHGLKFNASKTQLVYFGRVPVQDCVHKFVFCGKTQIWSCSQCKSG